MNIILHKCHYCKGSKDCFVDSRIIAQRSVDQGFERLRYFQSMRLHKEIFGAIVQTNAESINKNFENIGAAVPSKYIMSSSGNLFSTIH